MRNRNIAEYQKPCLVYYNLLLPADLIKENKTSLTMNLILTIVHKTKKINNLLQIQGNVCSLPDCHYQPS